MSNAQALINVLNMRKTLITELETYGVCVLPMAELISHSSGYNGEKFTVRTADFLSDVLQPLLNTAISDGDVPAIRSLTDAVVFVLTELQPQEQANG